MKTIDIFGYSFSAIKLRKLRAALTTLGVVIGIAAIVALLSITQGLQATITNSASTRIINQHVNCYTRQQRFSEAATSGRRRGCTGGGGGGGLGLGGGPAQVVLASTYTSIILIKLMLYRQIL